VASLPETIAVSPKPIVPKCWMNVAQEIVARSYVAGPEVSDPPEVIGPVVGVVKPAGKSEAGRSTDSSCVPVSWPVAAGSGVIDAEGAAPVAAGAEDTGAEDDAGPGDDGAGAEDEIAGAADGAGVEADDEELPVLEHPTMVTSTPAVAARAAKAGRRRRTTTDDTVQPTPELDPDT
jgi:hypothetical protein